MRIFVLVLSTVFIFSGCAKIKSLLPSAPKRGDSSAVSESPSPMTSLAKSEIGRVASINPDGRFVIVTFPLGGVPKTGKHLSVYRNAVKVAEVKVTGPQRNINTVADVTSGEAQVNDEVRAD